jgi:TRAP-type C4-dicarboxylate transport system permease small subunit
MTWKCAECGSENSEDSMRCTCGHVTQIDCEQRETSRKKVVPWIGAIFSICGVFYCFLGYAMVASYSVAVPERKAHWESMGWSYVAGVTVCSLLAVAFAVSIFRKRSKPVKPNTILG